MNLVILVIPHTPPNYGAKLKYTKDPDTTEILNDQGKKSMQIVSRTLLYLACAVDITLLTRLVPSHNNNPNPRQQS